MCISALNIFAVLSCSTGSKPSLLPGKAEGTHVWDQQPIYMATDTLKQGQCWCRAHQRHAYKYLHALEGGHMESTPFRLMTLLLHFLAHRFAVQAQPDWGAMLSGVNTNARLCLDASSAQTHKHQPTLCCNAANTLKC